MSEINDEVPVEVRFKRLAEAAWKAANSAVGSSYSQQESVAKIEAASRLAAVLIEGEMRRGQ